MCRTFAIGDIHGCAATFRKLLLYEIKITKQDNIYLLGDYIDRGPGSKEVIDLILSLKTENYQLHTVKGNHEQLFLDSQKDADNLDLWLANGGKATLKSFRIKSFDQLEDHYKHFFESTKYFYDTGDFIFVHAGLNFESKNIFGDTESMLWIRDMKVNKEMLGNKTIIHGHTPILISRVKINAANSFYNNTVNIDTGCCYKKYEGYGYLTALNVETMEFISIRNID